jgi:Flp pilus assembly CpaF family ATPase
VHPPDELSESQVWRASALKSALGQIVAFLDDARVVEVLLNAAGVVWVDILERPRIRTTGSAGRDSAHAPEASA